jgi:cell division inhibitor SepF
MAKSMRKMAVYLGLVDGGEEYDEQIEHIDDRPTEVYRNPAPRLVERSLGAVVLDRPVERPDRIVTLHPRNYNEARTLGEHFREGVPVIMNLTEMDEPDAKRLVDFAAGLVFGLHGSIERVTAKVFLLSPADIKVSQEDKNAAAQASFFNQS